MESITSEPTTPTINDFVDELVVGLINSRIYWGEHPRVLETIRELESMLPQLLSDDPDGTVQLAITADHLVYDQRPLLGASLSAPRLIQAIRERGAGGLEFDSATSGSDFQRLFELLANNPAEGETWTHCNDRLVECGCHTTRLLPPFRSEQRSSGVLRATDSTGTGDGPPVSLVPVELYQSVCNVLQDTTISVCHGGVVKFDDARTSIDNVLVNLEHDAASLFGLSRYERYDAFTFGHSIRVALLALQLARSLTSDKGLLNRVGVAALLHDVGKACVPFEILHCRTRLDPEQRAEMQKHPAYGAEILLDHTDCDPMASSAAFGHHITQAGNGYPKTAHDQQLSIVTKIVKICDVYEALTAVRPYKPAMSSIRAFRIMMSMKDAFDRRLLRRFIDIMGAYPTGTVVRMDSGEVARVRDQTRLVDSPIVELLTDPTGDLLADEHREVVDLSNPTGPGLSVVETLVDAKLDDFAASN